VAAGTRFASGRPRGLAGRTLCPRVRGVFASSGGRPGFFEVTPDETSAISVHSCLSLAEGEEL
jgi:hypothetical protein